MDGEEDGPRSGPDEQKHHLMRAHCRRLGIGNISRVWCEINRALGINSRRPVLGLEGKKFATQVNERGKRKIQHNRGKYRIVPT
ncbi:hypothetical protein ACFX2K_028325 [Malus domestica]